MSDNVTFARNLVKGKIAETIFAQMLRETHEFTVLEFGYEKIISELVQQGFDIESKAIKVLRTAPDFAVIDHSTRAVLLIEVKYLREMNPTFMLQHAERMRESWNPSYIFLATGDGFYFDDIKTICDNKGEISRLEHSQIPEDLQARYHKILKDFEHED
ncbi:MAG: hypothetical protein ACD_81C00186G0007 [uncultured bacterium]|uniref:Uncharacterized protein n=2 Tax=Candidatus Wolfeibacteriota TaxID=1752735 RepID=A0A0G1HAG6_9BACT|nr:MAG: hypothetical protein ACD_81C00186G0007 [uncultured bacterium]KKR12829.1 MAG: hypothetical protein UT41_C0001G0373 [Candidatus Wolfebacteria bacterium GW2011_GWC2_39_22]KKT43760.1 MAG: hypothetical protein UW32_C0001G0352 [Candidatus Wolfebacteria bacterium GW2011_GWE2_44_13]HBI25509.1 hypothetical protein [Candidatus Wolfebacteria bacterium]